MWSLRPHGGRSQTLGDHEVKLAEANAEPRSTAGTAEAAMLLIVLAALMQIYDGLSSVLLPFLGHASRGIGLTGWMVATGTLQLVVAIAALVHATRHHLRGATLGVALSILLGWLTTVPPAVQHGLDFRADAVITSGYFVLSPVIAFTAGALAWRGSYPVLAALIVTAPTFVGLLFVIVFTISVALYGF
jgi:hypothetical protein